MSTENPPSARDERGQALEGYAFTFCKAAFLALLFSRYTLLITASAAVMLYIAAAGYGVREWRCFLKPPWVVIVLAVIALAQGALFFWYHSSVIL